MAYVSPQGPLPRNSFDPVTACEAARAKAVVDGVEAMAARGKWASAQIAGPNSFRQFGPALVIDVARSQNGMVAASVPSSTQIRPDAKTETRAAPTVVPLNVSIEEYACCTSMGVQATPIAPPHLDMPPTMPAPVQVPRTAGPPKYKNLCWALRNGAVDPSQFDPTEFAALQYRCSQLGYAGACIPPPLIALYLDQQRRAGTLPHISVPQSMLDAIEPAPPLTAVPCQQSWSMGGMAGYRGLGANNAWLAAQTGLGAAWGDAGALPCNWNTDNPAPGVSWLPVGLFVAAVVGLAWGSR